MNCLALAVLALFVVLFVMMGRTRGKSSEYTETVIFGSPKCGWCQKQVAYMDKMALPYHFVNCDTDYCPDFVSGYPTMIVNNKIVHGYQEIR
jgi:hypothetical protein